MIGFLQNFVETKSVKDHLVAAHQKQRQLDSPDRIASLLSQVKDVSRTLRGVSAADLLDHGHRLRRMSVTAERTSKQASANDQRDALLVLALAGMVESVRQHLSLEMFDTQVSGAICVAQGAVVEMQTGEGKTLSAAAAAFAKSIDGQGVHVATPSAYLANRDQSRMERVFAALGATVSVINDADAAADRRDAYAADITYAAGHVFGFDYLRDQVALGDAVHLELGDRTLARLSGHDGSESRLQRGLSVAIVDEIDQVLIDDAVSPLLLSSSETGEASDACIHAEAMRWSDRLLNGRDFTVSNGNAIDLTDVGYHDAYENTAAVVHPKLKRPWHDYVVLALRAKYCYRSNVHYIVRDGQLHLLDSSTGRIHPDRSWSGGLHQAIQMREGLTVEPESQPIARITRQRFFRNYAFVGGMTGTADGCRHELGSVYGLPVVCLPTRTATKRTILPTHLSKTRSEKCNAIAHDAIKLADQGRAVLIGTLSISASWEVAAAIVERGSVCQVLNGVQDEDEASVIAKAGRRGCITVATNMAGRGTDILVDPAVVAIGGLHVIVVEHHSLARVDRQLIGRGARCGDPGTARFYVSADDDLIVNDAPWIARSIQRYAHRERQDRQAIDEAIRQAQHQFQRRQTSQRMRLLRADHDDEKLWNVDASSPRGCIQL
ncbi:preprotein translocase subunit SecA [Rubripirellula tenax]|uniref:Preprotein translocase subunit SecA n=1 Tax=Rubripirellula tenax TaxID=2528015 RepID=A0A5C6F838_9BACT|nr:preprotein translocase subunit SecA [Rubripirellula tenax]TWU56567.1 preprotein translocase subunit SecA [Rubripirellula tenax]